MIINKMSYSDQVHHTGQVLAQFFAGKATVEAAESAVKGMLFNSEVLEGAMTRGHYMSQEELQVLSRSIELQSRIATRNVEALRKPTKWLDFFAANGIIKPTAISNQFRMVKTISYSEGDVSFISDMTDDLPTQPGMENAYDGVKIHPTGNSVRVGLLELRDAARDGRDLIGEGIRKQLEGHRRFADSIIGDGAPGKGIFGLLNNPRLLADVQTVPPSFDNPPFTDWARKSVAEIYSDLNAMKQYGYTKSLENAYPNAIIVAESAHNALIQGIANQVTGNTIKGQWLTTQAQDGTGTVTQVIPANLLNAAAADGVSNVALVGDFNGDNIEMYYATPEILPTQNHGLHFHIPIISAISDVFIARPEFLSKWEAM